MDFASVFPSYGFDDDESLDFERETDSTYERIIIDGERFHVTSCRAIGWGDLHEIDTEEGESFILSEDSETAGDAARERWADMAANDPTEFRCMVGDQALIAWALGQSYAPGSVACSSLDEWLDLCATVPNEEWASYDGNEREIDRVGKLASELGYIPGVAYRTN